MNAVHTIQLRTVAIVPHGAHARLVDRDGGDREQRGHEERRCQPPFQALSARIHAIVRQSGALPSPVPRKSGRGIACHAEDFYGSVYFLDLRVMLASSDTFVPAAGLCETTFQLRSMIRARPWPVASSSERL